MERSDVAYQNRISASMFTRTMSAAMDWSMVSNESLFSIQLGNPSFSREHVFLTGRSRDLINFPMDPYLPSAAEPANAAAMQGVLRVNAEKVGSKDKHPSDMHPSASIFNCFNSRMARLRSFALPLLTDGRSGSVKVGPGDQLHRWAHAEQNPPHSETTKAAHAAKCFPCFSCSFCCRGSVSDQ